MTSNSLQELKRVIEEDLGKRTSKKIRFINVEHMVTWVKIKDMLTSYSQNHVLLSNYCSDKDLTPKMLRLIADLKKTKTNTIVLPLSEHLRINNAVVDQLLNNIVSLDHELGSSEENFRIYFPMYRMKTALQKLIQSDIRLKDSIWFLDMGQSDDDYTLTILPRTSTTKIDGNNLDGYRDYLSYWEDNPCKPIILRTNNAAYYKNNIYHDNVIVLTSAYDILKFHKIIDSSIDEKYGEEEYWEAILKDIGQHTTLISYLEKHFSLKTFNPDDLVKRWNKQNDNYEHWLIWLWLKIENCSFYLKHCIAKSHKPSEFLTKVATEIFDFVPSSNNYWQIYFERKELLKILNLKILPYMFWEKWDYLTVNKKYYYLTDLTQREKEEIILGIEEIGKYRNSYLVLKNIYQDLTAYLNRYPSNFTEIDEYFDIYRKQKLVNKFSDTFLQKVEAIGKEKGLWWKLGMKSRNSLVDEIYDTKSYIFYIDALGAEFYWLIVYLLENEFPSVCYDAHLSFAELPTITGFNNEFVLNRNAEPRIPDLDNIKHDGVYPGYICAEIEIIRYIIQKAISKLESYDKIIITGDHGASRGVVLAKGHTVKADNGVVGERGGRYCVDENTSYESRLPCCLDIANYHVHANYDRFSVSGAPKNETHGGASLEEVLVPVIVLAKQPLKDKIFIINYDSKTKLKDGKAHVTFKLNKKIDGVTAIVLGERYPCFKENDFWYFEATVTTRTEYTAQIVRGGVIGEFKYQVQKGIKSRQDI